jgi:hypothetical protein
LGADDLIDTLSGTLGLGGAVDSVLILGTEGKIARNATKTKSSSGGEVAILKNSVSQFSRTKKRDGRFLAHGWRFNRLWSEKTLFQRWQRVIGL